MPNADRVQAHATLAVGGLPTTLAECRSAGLPDTCRRVLEVCLGQLDGQLRGTGTGIGSARRSARQMLRELAALIGSDRLGLGRGDYQRLLGRLSLIFATGPDASPRDALTTTAPGYAGVVAAISRACPSCDYEAALGQLLTYMARLFLDRRSGWKSIYRSIRAISDGVAAKQRLDDAELGRIQEWIESGAANLFHIQRDLGRAIDHLDGQIRALDAQIAERAAALNLAARRRRGDSALSNVISLDAWRQGLGLTELERERLDLLDQIDAKRAIKGLVDSDIRELEEALRATQRSYFIHLAWSSGARPRPRSATTAGTGRTRPA